MLQACDSTSDAVLVSQAKQPGLRLRIAQTSSESDLMRPSTGWPLIGRNDETCICGHCCSGLSRSSAYAFGLNSSRA